MPTLDAVPRVLSMSATNVTRSAFVGSAGCSGGTAGEALQRWARVRTVYTYHAASWARARAQPLVIETDTKFQGTCRARRRR